MRLVVRVVIMMIVLFVMLVTVCWVMVLYVGCKAASKAIRRAVKNLKMRPIIAQLVNDCSEGLIEELVAALALLPIWIITGQNPFDVD